MSTQVQYLFWYIRPLIVYSKYAYKPWYKLKNAERVFGMHAKAEQDRKKIKFSWLTLVSQPVVKFKNRYCMLADY